jgi:hypothetical protein
MSIQELASEIRSSLSRLKAERSGLAGRIADMMGEWSNGLYPLTEIMKEYKIPYRNAHIIGKSEKGFLVGEGFSPGGERILYVFTGLYVYAVNAETDKRVDESDGGMIETSDFVKTADLEQIKSGFDYVRNLKETVLRDYSERNKSMRKFLDEIGG